MAAPLQISSGAQWLSGRVLDSSEGLLVQASLETLCCVLEQDTLVLAKLVLVQPRKTRPDKTEKLLTET